MKKVIVFFAVLSTLVFSACLSDDAAVQWNAINVADAADLAEVRELSWEPRRNPAASRADSAVYALPALPLKPEAERLPPPVYAISGVKGQPISKVSPNEAVDIIIDLPEREAFVRGILEGTDISDWFENLPAGLEALAHSVKKGSNQIKIYIDGIPQTTSRTEVRVVVPGLYLNGNRDLRFASPTEQASMDAWSASQSAAE